MAKVEALLNPYIHIVERMEPLGMQAVLCQGQQLLLVCRVEQNPRLVEVGSKLVMLSSPAVIASVI